MKESWPELDRVVAAARAAGPASTCPDPEAIAAFYLDAHTPGEADVVREHVAACARCLSVARDAQTFAAAGRPSAAAGRLPSWHRPLAAAAALFGILLAGSVLWRRGAPGAPGLPPDVRPTKATYVPVDAGLLFRGDDDGGAQAAFAAAMEPYLRDDFREAAVRLSAYVALEPGDDRARLYLGVSRLLHGDAPQAALDLEPLATAGDPWIRGEAAYQRALALATSGRSREAATLLQGLARMDHPRASEAAALAGRLASP